MKDLLIAVWRNEIIYVNGSCFIDLGKTYKERLTTECITVIAEHTAQTGPASSVPHHWYQSQGLLMSLLEISEQQSPTRPGKPPVRS